MHTSVNITSEKSIQKKAQELKTMLGPQSRHVLFYYCECSVLQSAQVVEFSTDMPVTIDGVADRYHAHNYVEITVIAISYSNMTQPEGAPNRFTPSTFSLR